ncbi:hypothetical protein KC878_03765 [Candidatus Saccharibacteria bacterium]|nr:hypothetical protein [Candidatus Saccharibacteria bacterium]MCB9821726.1 hypothetical protein [Candidatus Nomurabacteria bacterium]
MGKYVLRCKRFLVKNKQLVFFFSIPALIAITMFAVLYVPSMFSNPQYGFIYQSCLYGRCYSNNSYIVDSSGTVQVVDPLDTYKPNYDYLSDNSQLYLYDPLDSSSKQISLEEAQTYSLDTSVTSPDGYKLENSSNTSGPFVYSYNEGHGIYKKGLLSKKIDVDNFYKEQFLGWVINE